MKIKVLKPDSKIVFRKACPYCKGNLIVQANEWEEDDVPGFWYALGIDVDCSNMPQFDSDEWDEWNAIHSKEIYDIWHPVVDRIKGIINEKYRFDLSDLT